MTFHSIKVTVDAGKVWQPSMAPTTRGKPLKSSKPSATSTALAPYSK